MRNPTLPRATLDLLQHGLRALSNAAPRDSDRSAVAKLAPGSPVLLPMAQLVAISAPGFSSVYANAPVRKPDTRTWGEAAHGEHARAQYANGLPSTRTLNGKTVAPTGLVKLTIRLP